MSHNGSHIAASAVAIAYHSGFGHTAVLAEAVGAGARDASAHVTIIAVDRMVAEDWDVLDGADAIVFGSATYMGGPAGQFKTFADATGAKWFTSAWRDKIASGFSVSSSPSGDKFSTLQYFHTLAMQHGMIWVGLGEMPMQPNGVNRLGSFAGATAQAGQESPDVKPSAEDKLTGEILGKRVAEYAVKLKK